MHTPLEHLTYAVAAAQRHNTVLFVHHCSVACAPFTSLTPRHILAIGAAMQEAVHDSDMSPSAAAEHVLHVIAELRAEEAESEAAREAELKAAKEAELKAARAGRIHPCPPGKDAEHG